MDSPVLRLVVLAVAVAAALVFLGGRSGLHMPGRGKPVSGFSAPNLAPGASQALRGIGR